MEQTQPRRPGLPWGAALKGGFIAVAAPLIFWMVLSLTSDEQAQGAIGWVFVAAILASPVIFALGAAGGVVAHVARGPQLA